MAKCKVAAVVIESIFRMGPWHRKCFALRRGYASGYSEWNVFRDLFLVKIVYRSSFDLYNF